MMTLSQSRIKDDFIFAPYLVLYLPLYELDGASFMSKDAYGHLCTATGAIWRPSGRYFEGLDDHVRMPAGIFPANDFSIVLWFRSPALGALQSLFTTQDDYYSYLMLHNTTNKLKFAVDIGASSYDVYSDNALAGDNTYHCAVATKSSTDGIKLYIDGVLQTDVDATATGDCNAIAGYSLIGRYCSSPPTYEYPFQGTIPLVIFFRKVLSAIEAQRLYLATKWRYR